MSAWRIYRSITMTQLPKVAPKKSELEGYKGSSLGSSWMWSTLSPPHTSNLASDACPFSFSPIRFHQPSTVMPTPPSLGGFVSQCVLTDPRIEEMNIASIAVEWCDMVQIALNGIWIDHRYVTISLLSIPKWCCFGLSALHLNFTIPFSAFSMYAAHVGYTLYITFLNHIMATFITAFLKRSTLWDISQASSSSGLQESLLISSKLQA